MSDTLETWENARRGDVWLLRFDHSGKVVSEPVRGGRRVTISTKERKLNQDRAYDIGSDVFSNGALVPVGGAQAFDGIEDYQEIASNPNLMSTDDLKELLKLKAPQLKKRLEEITNVITVTRLHELASSEEASLTLPQFRAIETRLAQLNGEAPLDYEQVEVINP